MLSVFFIWCFLCPVRCLLSFFAVPLFLGSLFEKIFGSELLFLGVGVGLACFGAVLPMFLLYYLLFRSRNCLEKILLMSGLVFLGFLLSSFGCLADVAVFFFFFFERDSSGSHRAHPHTHLFCFFLFCFCVPPRLFLPVLAVRPASWRFFGVPFWTPRVFGILLGPSEAFFLGREAARVFCASLALFFFFPVSLCFAAVFFTRTRRGGPVIVRGIPPGHRACPSPE